MGIFCSPSWMKTGRIMFAGEMVVSEMASRMLGLRLFLLGLDGKSCSYRNALNVYISRSSLPSTTHAH